MLGMPRKLNTTDQLNLLFDSTQIIVLIMGPDGKFVYLDIDPLETWKVASRPPSKGILSVPRVDLGHGSGVQGGKSQGDRPLEFQRGSDPTDL